MQLWELGLRGGASSWRSLRRRRASAASREARGQLDRARRATFQNALEQAEQQFRAAAGIGYESRALNLFYGLSQAGRAIAAAAPALGEEQWKLIGHGVVANPDRTAGSWETLISQPDLRRSGSFTTLSQVLTSAATERVTLGDLWPLIPETTTLGPPPAGLIHPTLMINLGMTMGIQEAGRATLDITIPPSLVAVGSDDRPPLQAWLERYPSLAGWAPANEPKAAPAQWPPAHAQLSLYRDLLSGEDGSHSGLSAPFTRYRGHLVALPRLGTEQQARHPLMIWWAVLHGLSMFTRYAPDQWTRAIDVDVVGSATRIEVLLDAALDAVPDLIDEAIAALWEVTPRRPSTA